LVMPFSVSTILKIFDLHMSISTMSRASTATSNSIFFLILVGCEQH
jgi:hypothetical protein